MQKKSSGLQSLEQVKKKIIIYFSPFFCVIIILILNKIKALANGYDKFKELDKDKDMSFLRSQKGYNDVVKKYKGGKRLGGLFGKKKKPQPAPVAPAKAAESKGFLFYRLYSFWFFF